MKFTDGYIYPHYIYKKMVKNQFDAATKSIEESGGGMKKFFCPLTWMKAYKAAEAAGMQTLYEYDAWQKFLIKL
jgi:hypothetical protein